MMKVVIAGAIVLMGGIPCLGEAQEARKKYDRDLITREEIQDRSPDSRTAFEVVQRLRPHFLRERSSGSISSPLTAEGNRNTPAVKTPVQVYIDGAKIGPASYALRNIQANAVIDILYLNASDATTRFGTGHDNGAIVVRTGT
jgi:hypothetical protein